MPTGPKGQKRPADVIVNAIRVAKIATGEIEEEALADDGKDKAAQALGKKGGAARAEVYDARAPGGNCEESGREEMERPITADQCTDCEWR